MEAVEEAMEAVEEAMEAVEEAMEAVEEATGKEVEEPRYASSINKGIVPLVQIADLNTRVMAVVVTVAMAQMADMVEVTKDTEVVVEAMEEEVGIAVAVVVVVPEYASTTKKVLVVMETIADSSINRLFMKMISLP